MAGVSQKKPILQSRLIDPPWALKGGSRLPGTSPIEPDDWLRWDDAYAAQMAERDRLIAGRPELVHSLSDTAKPAAQELLASTFKILKSNKKYKIYLRQIRRPDGVTIRLDPDAPLRTLGRLVQQDFCILQPKDPKPGAEHLMTGAILCFPASWTLSEKIGKPLTGIHRPVDDYDSNIAKRVQRLFDAIQPGRPLVRANCLLYADSALYQPRSETAPRETPTPDAAYVRSERQCLLRLPETKAVVFSIHTTVVRRDKLSPAEVRAMAQHLADPLRP